MLINGLIECTDWGDVWNVFHHRGTKKFSNMEEQKIQTII